MFIYAQIQKNDDGYGYIVSISYLSGEVIAENMIPVSEDFCYTNKRWNYQTKNWEVYEPTPLPEREPEPSQLDRIETEIKKKNNDIAKRAVDKYTEELLEQGVI